MFFIFLMVAASASHPLQKLLDNTLSKNRIFGTVLTVADSSGKVLFQGASGNLTPETPFFIASTTKLYTTAIIMQLRSEGKLSPDDRIDRFIDSTVLKNLHVLKGKDYSRSITIRQLLAHTSGLPDYFQGKPRGGKSLETLLMSGQDQRWSAFEALERSKTITPPFAPGSPGKALYSDTNFQLLGLIIEKITGLSYAEAVHERIVKPLGLTSTWCYTDPADKRPAPLFYKNAPLPIPLAMVSFGPDGGIVSTSGELMTFTVAFFLGRLFPPAYLQEMKVFNPIFFPYKAGVGMMYSKLPRFFSPFAPLPSLLGHSGLSGAFAFYSPEKNVFVCGTVNQVADPGTSYKLMLKALSKL
jgi:CubicO group peptidase (beta-lactamase class C family)